MQIKDIKTLVARLGAIVDGWDEKVGAPAVERHIAASLLAELYEAVKFDAALAATTLAETEKVEEEVAVEPMAVVEQSTEAADQGFQRVFRVAAFLVGPEQLNEAIIGYSSIVFENQILQKRHTLLGFQDTGILAVVVNIEVEPPEHANANIGIHNGPPKNIKFDFIIPHHRQLDNVVFAENGKNRK